MMVIQDHGLNITKAIKKYGKENFKKEILYFCEDKESLNKKEREIVNEEFISRDDTYNLCLGGQADTEQWAKAGIKAIKKILSDPEKRKEHIEKIKKAQAEIGFNYKTFVGKKHKESTKQLMSEIAKTRTGELNSSFGTCWIYNEKLNKNKKIKKEDLQNWLDQGWIKGRKMLNLSNESKEKMMKRKGSFWITNGIESKQIFNASEIPDGWYKGRIMKIK